MKCKLSDICSFRKGKVEVENLNAKNYISTENMLPNKCGITEASSLPTVSLTQEYNSGDVLVSNIRPYFKKIWQAEYDGGCSNDVLVFVPKPNTDKDFLYYVLADDDFFTYSMATSKGTKMPRGDKTSIMQYEVPLIDLQVQKKIASVLKALDEKIKLNNEINNNLEQQAQLLFLSWFSNTNCYIDNDWHIRKFGEVARFSQGMQVPITEQLLFPTHGYERFIRIVDITQPSNQDIRYIKSTDKGKVFASDIFMIRYGSPGIVARNYEGIIANNLFTIYPTTSELSNDYIYYYLKSNEIQKYIVQNAVSSTMPAINFSTLKNLDIIIPDSISMQQFTDFSKTVRLIQYNIKQENQRLAQLRDALFPKLMSGELDVSDIEL